MSSKTYRPLTRGKLRAGDQALYADYQQDCMAVCRWHRVKTDKFGSEVAYLRSKTGVSFRRPV